jgi:hypothetical protein
MLLVHGSRLTNFVGILSKGLKIAPPDVPASGYLFGKGVFLICFFLKFLLKKYKTTKANYNLQDCTLRICSRRALTIAGTCF